MYIRAASLVILTVAVVAHFVQPQSIPSTENCTTPIPGVIINNPCKPLLDGKGVNISVEPFDSSRLRNKYIGIPESKGNDFDKWQFLRIDCSERKGTPLNVSDIITYNLPYIIAMINCSIVPSTVQLTKPATNLEKRPLDILLVNCIIESPVISTNNQAGLIIQSSMLPSRFVVSSLSKLIVVNSRASSYMKFEIYNRMEKFMVIPDLKNSINGKVFFRANSGIQECSLDDSKLTLDLESNVEAIQKCGVPSGLAVVKEGISSNIDIIVLIGISVTAVFISKLDPKQRARPVATLSISFLSAYSSISRLIMNRPDDFTVPSQVAFMIMFFPIIFSVSHSLYMSPRLCRRYSLPNNFLTWFLITIGPSNIELLWSNFFRLKCLSSKKPNIKPEILGLLELNRSIAQDILVIFISERLQREVTIGKILRNCVTVLSLIMTLREWKTGRLYEKLGYVLLVLPCLLNIVLMFPNGELYKIGYVIFLVSLSVFTSTLLLITKHTAEGSARYTDFAFYLGPISVIGINVLTISTVTRFNLITGYGGPMFLMTMMSLMCLVTNTCHYHNVWEKYEENQNTITGKEKI